MTRKLGQIIAVRENTWMIRIPMGCDTQVCVISTSRGLWRAMARRMSRNHT